MSLSSGLKICPFRYFECSSFSLAFLVRLKIWQILWGGNLFVAFCRLSIKKLEDFILFSKLPYFTWHQHLAKHSRGEENVFPGLQVTSPCSLRQGPQLFIFPSRTPLLWSGNQILGLHQNQRKVLHGMKMANHLSSARRALPFLEFYII